jgi:uncharacterized protein (DUF302 family)
MTTASPPHYEFVVDVPMEFDGVEQRVRNLLRDEGFGVLTEIDVAATLKEKLGADFHPYTILGACNPPLAHRALEAEPGVGVLLPCNVVIEEVTPGHCRVRFMDPIAALALVGEAVAEVARDASARLHRVSERLIEPVTDVRFVVANGN